VKPSRPCLLQTASGEIIQVLNERLVKLILGRSVFKIWVFVAEITDEMILALHVLRTYDASVNMG
jgi:hypothetical protein